MTLYVCFTNPLVKLCFSMGKRVFLLQNYHCSCKKIPKPVQVLGHTTTKNNLSSVENNMRLWNPAVSDFNNPNFILLKVTVSQRLCVWGTRLLQVSNAKAEAVFFDSQTSPKQNKIRKEDTLYFNLQCFKALFLIKKYVSCESRGQATVPDKKMGELWWNSTWQGSKTAVPWASEAEARLPVLCTTDSTQQLVCSSCSSSHYNSAYTCRLQEHKHWLCAWV